LSGSFVLLVEREFLNWNFRLARDNDWLRKRSLCQIGLGYGVLNFQNLIYNFPGF